MSEENNNVSQVEENTSNEVQEETSNSFKESLQVDTNNKIADELIETRKELEDITDRYKRILAEFENHKKRSQKERTMLYSSILADIAEQLLPIMDNLENAVKAQTEDEEYKKGVELVLKQFKDLLTSKGIEEIKAVGEPFDPALHEAVSSIQDPNLGEKVVASEYRKGYRIGDKVIRHSMVIVAN